MNNKTKRELLGLQSYPYFNDWCTLVTNAVFMDWRDEQTHHSVITLTLVVRGGAQFLPAGNTQVYRHLPGNSPSSRPFQSTVCVFMIGVLDISPIGIQFSFPFSLTTQLPLTIASQQNWKLDKDVFWVKMHVCMYRQIWICLLREPLFAYRVSWVNGGIVSWSESEHLMTGTCEHKYNSWFEIYIHCKMMPTVSLVNTHHRTFTKCCVGGEDL